MNLIILNNIEIGVSKKNIKNIHLSVIPPDGMVKISVPLNVSDDAIVAFASSKLSWIKRQIASIKNQSRESKRNYVSGESFYLFGKRFLFNTYTGKKNSIEIKNERVLLTIKEKCSEMQKEKYVLSWYRNQLKYTLNNLLINLQEKTNLIPNSWQIKDMKTKWGSCTKEKKKLWFNLQLAKKPVECIEYVVLHELLHLKYEKHNDVFKKMLSLYMPNWKEQKEKLNAFILDYIN